MYTKCIQDVYKMFPHFDKLLYIICAQILANICQNVGYIFCTSFIHFVYISCLYLVQFLHAKCIHDIHVKT